MRRALSLVLLPAALGCQKNVSTPPGTVILEWQLSQATRPNVATAKEVGPRTSKDTTFRVQPERRGPAAFAVHVETAPIELEQEGKRAPHASPVAVRIKVERNEDWTVSGRCDGPNYRAPSYAAVVPEDMILSCALDLRYQNTFASFPFSVSLEVTGDGSAQPTFVGGTVSPD